MKKYFNPIKFNNETINIVKRKDTNHRIVSILWHTALMTNPGVSHQAPFVVEKSKINGVLKNLQVREEEKPAYDLMKGYLKSFTTKYILVL